MKKRIVSLLLALVMVLGLIPAVSAAEEVVYLSVSNDGSFVTTSSGTVMAHVPVALSELKKISLEDYGLSDFNYDADGDGSYDVTALHLCIYSHEKLYGQSWNETVQVSGSAGSIYLAGGFWGFEANMTYYFNGEYPINEELSVQWGMDTGATLDVLVLKDGDYLDVAGYSDWGFFSDPEAGFRYFLDDAGKITHTYTVGKGSALTVSLAASRQSWENYTELTMVMAPEAGDTICYSQTLLASDAATVTADENGKATLALDRMGTWYLWSEGSSVASPAYAKVEVVWENPYEITADWANFRGSDTNMALTSAPTPKDIVTTTLKWAAKLGSGWSANPSVQIIADNALVLMCGTSLLKLDLQSGETLATGTMSASPSFGYTPATYADGLILCPLGGGIVEAFDAKTLESVWIYKDALGGQALSPITYSDGCVYTGFWNGENKDANYVCLQLSSGKLVWNKTVTGGFYWAGSVAVGDSLIVGSDDGASGYTGDSHLYSLNKKDGSLISELTLTGCGDQRSSIAYIAEKGRVYFTAKNGYLCSAAVDTSTGELSDLKTSKQANQCTSTPVVYGDHVYFSAGSGVVTGSNGAGNFIVADADTLEQHYAVALKAYPQGSVLISDAYLNETGKLYCYSTYNGKPGGLSMIKVDPTKNTIDGAELVEIYDAAGYEQYCITSPICGTDGTIYYKNDSGNVLAVGTNLAYLTDISADVGHLAEPFAAHKAAHELVVPVGTQSVTLNATACEGGTVTLNGGEISVPVILTEGAATVTLEVTKDTDSRTYTLAIRTEDTNADLSGLKASNSNSYSNTSNDRAMTPAFDADTCFYGVYDVPEGKSFVNLWPDAASVYASVTVFALNNVAEGQYDSETGIISVTATNAGHNRYALYFADAAKPMAVRVTVTAENGDSKDYTVVLSAAAATEEAQTLLAQLEKEAADKAAAGEVAALIEAIGEVALEDEEAIAAARAAYEALTEEQKALVENYDALVAAEEALEALKKEAADKAAAGEVAALIEVIGEVTLEDEEAIAAARAAYEALTEEQKALVENYDALVAAEKALEELKQPVEEPWVNPYTDVAETDWFYSAVKYCTENGLMNGMSDTAFEPQTKMTRAMLVTVLYRTEGAPDAGAYENPFRDVDDGWYTDAVCWAAANGIVKGTSADTFDPNASVTREQMVTILFRYAAYKGVAGENRMELTEFADSGAVSGYATEAMQWAVAEEIIQGSLEGGKSYILPADSAARAEIATVLMRFLENMTE